MYHGMTRSKTSPAGQGMKRAGGSADYCDDLSATFAIISATDTVLQSIPAFRTAALARVKRSKSATAGWLCQNTIDFNDIATLRQV
jgi:hypothetical protein